MPPAGGFSVAKLARQLEGYEGKRVEWELALDESIDALAKMVAYVRRDHDRQAKCLEEILAILRSRPRRPPKPAGVSNPI